MKLIIFAGGVGTRLWPLSRKNTPKQFGKIIGDKSTLQQTVERLLPKFRPQDIYISTGGNYKHIIQAQLPYIPEDNYILEPARRDLAAAIGLAVFVLEKSFPDETIAILWSDHIMKNEERFRNALAMAEEKVDTGNSPFVFIAQKARFANQNCGWIELGKKLEHSNENDLYKFIRLKYRPALEEAEQFFTKENFVWNLGYFVTTPRFITSLYRQYMPDMCDKLSLIADAWQTKSFNQKVQEIYPMLEIISFDDAILMKIQSDQLLVISSDLGWSDVGTWDALKEALTTSKDENISQGSVLLENSKDTIMFNYTRQICVGIDLNELVVVNTGDVLLICPKHSIPKIKKFVEKLDGGPHENLA